MVKGLFQSKTVLAALIALALSILGFFLKKDFPPEVSQQLAALDWVNTGQAIVSAFIILIRVVFPPAAKIRGLWSSAGSLLK
jgi:hypothetical protein